MKRALAFGVLALVPRLAPAADAPSGLQPMDVFALEHASDPQVSPNGSRVVYVRGFMDVMKDRRRSNLWLVSEDGSSHRPLTSGNRNDVSPRWSPGGDRIAWVSADDGKAQIHVRYMDTGETAVISRLTESPSGLAWSPDGRQLAFFMHVPDRRSRWWSRPCGPRAPSGHRPPRVIDRLVYRADGRGYLRDGHAQLFVMSAEGGARRQLTAGPVRPRGTGRVDAGRRLRPPLGEPARGRRVRPPRHRGVRGGPRRREGPAPHHPARAGRIARGVARRRARRLPRLRRRVPVLPGDAALRDETATAAGRGASPRRSTGTSSRPSRRVDGKGIYVQYDDEGDTKIALVSLDGRVTTLAGGVGGTSIGRPYSGVVLGVVERADRLHLVPAGAAGRRLSRRAGTREARGASRGSTRTCWPTGRSARSRSCGGRRRRTGGGSRAGW